MRRIHSILASALIWATCQLAFASSTELVGGPGGEWYSRQCPAGQKIVGVTGNTGQWVDDVSIICASVSNNTWSNPIPQPMVGSAPSVGAIIGIVAGGTTGNTARTCPQGMAVSAMRVLVGNELPPVADRLPGPFIHKLTPVCRSMAAGATVNGPGIRGSNGDGTTRVLSCPRNNYASGITGRSGQYLDSIRLDCTKLSGRVPEDTVIEVGGTGGQHTTSVCPSGRRMIGMRAQKSPTGGWLRNMTPLCATMPRWNPAELTAALTSNRNLQNVGAARKVGRSGGGESKNILCPENQYVHSAELFHESYVHSVRLRCRTTDHAKRSAPSRFGRAKGNRDLLQCPPDTVATGITVRAGDPAIGAAIDAFRLRCFADNQARSSKLIAILGDSYGAGEGAPDMNVYAGERPTHEKQKSRERRAAWANRMCHMSNRSGLSRAVRDYTVAKKGAYDYRNFSCSGAEIELGFVDGQENPPQSKAMIDPQIGQAYRWMRNMGKSSIDTVVISVGGNDAGFAARIADCTITELVELGTFGLASGSCSEDPSYQQDIAQGLSTLPRRFALLAEELKVLKPRRVLIRTYPNPLRNTDGELCNSPPADGPRPAPLTASRAVYAAFPDINAGSYRLVEDTFLKPVNAGLRAAANIHGWEVIEGWFEATARRGVCAIGDERAFNQPSDAYVKQGNNGGVFHPNTLGYDLERNVTLAALNRSPRALNSNLKLKQQLPATLKKRPPVPRLKKSSQPSKRIEKK